MVGTLAVCGLRDTNDRISTSKNKEYCLRNAKQFLISYTAWYLQREIRRTING